MDHDLTEQPVKGARAYLIYSVLHDLLDDVYNQSLTHLAEAMKPRV